MTKRKSTKPAKTTGDPLCNADFKGQLCTRENHDDGFHSYDFEKPEEYRTSSDVNNARCEGYVFNSRCQRAKGHPGACRIFRTFTNALVPDDNRKDQPFIIS